MKSFYVMGCSGSLLILRLFSIIIPDLMQLKVKKNDENVRNLTKCLTQRKQQNLDRSICFVIRYNSCMRNETDRGLSSNILKY